jgi:hypothetical protein
MEYNPNPTVYRPTHRRVLGRAGSLWMVDDDAADADADDEPIDTDEVFGARAVPTTASNRALTAGQT